MDAGNKPRRRRGRANGRMGEEITPGSGGEADIANEINDPTQERESNKRPIVRLPIRASNRTNSKRTAVLEFCLIMSIFVSAGSLFSLAIMGFSIAQAVHEEFILEKETSTNMQAIIDNIKKDLADVESLKKTTPIIKK